MRCSSSGARAVAGALLMLVIAGSASACMPDTDAVPAERATGAEGTRGDDPLGPSDPNERERRRSDENAE